jgi:hypothetical protein
MSRPGYQILNMTHTSNSDRVAGRLVPRSILAVALLAIVGPAATAAPVALAPQYAGQYATGNGANARFMQIAPDWRGSTVLWDEGIRAYGSGVAIGSLAWGTGLWGQADWATVQQAAQKMQGGAGSSAPAIVNSWTGTVDVINHANALYNRLYSQQWGAAALLPFFEASGAPAEQENWTAHFTGFIRVVEAGFYDFSVLNDDGFFLSLVGAGGARVETARDFLNPRDRNGFGDGLELDAGLYGFELGQWNRMETGVVDLRWRHGDSSEWVLVPTAHLLTDVRPALAVPEPGSNWLVGAALAALLLCGRSGIQRGRATTRSTCRSTP